jgi:L-threonylcarbamoyladenylate synthase
MEIYTAKTIVVAISSTTPQPETIAQAAEVIRQGGLVAFPTETVYGLGANALDRSALERIFSAKERPANDPIIAHIAAVADLTQLAKDIPDEAYKLAQMFWPGPLTMVLHRADNVPANIAAGLSTVAVRMPSYLVARALIEAAGVPIAAPSANKFTRPSSTTAAHVLEDLQGHVDMVLDGGETPIGIESTVIDMTQTPPVVLRPGGLLFEDIQQVIPEVTMMPRQISIGTETPASSPGMMTKHYSPRADVLLYDGERNAVLNAMREQAMTLIHEHKRVGILTANEEAAYFVNTGARIISIGSRREPQQIAHVLFGAMRALDNQQVDKILVRSYGKQGLGAAIWDRLLRSADGRVYRVS